MASMGTCRGGVGLGTLGGRLYAVGGHDSHNYLNTVEAYDPDTKRYCALLSLLQQFFFNLWTFVLAYNLNLNWGLNLHLSCHQGVLKK